MAHSSTSFLIFSSAQTDFALIALSFEGVSASIAGQNIEIARILQ